MSDSLESIIIDALEDIKAQNIAILDVRELTGIMDKMVVASGTSTRQVKALADNVVARAKQAGYRPIGVEGEDTAEWILVDFGDIIVHLMLPATRAFYDLEKLWSFRPGETLRSEED